MHNMPVGLSQSYDHAPLLALELRNRHQKAPSLQGRRKIHVYRIGITDNQMQNEKLNGGLSP